LVKQEFINSHRNQKKHTVPQVHLSPHMVFQVLFQKFEVLHLYMAYQNWWYFCWCMLLMNCRRIDSVTERKKRCLFKHN